VILDLAMATSIPPSELEAMTADELEYLVDALSSRK